MEGGHEFVADSSLLDTIIDQEQGEDEASGRIGLGTLPPSLVLLMVCDAIPLTSGD